VFRKISQAEEADCATIRPRFLALLSTSANASYVKYKVEKAAMLFIFSPSLSPYFPPFSLSLCSTKVSVCVARIVRNYGWLGALQHGIGMSRAPPTSPLNYVTCSYETNKPSSKQFPW
jgi:hypothetical protein